MNWQILVFINALFVGISVILIRSLARDKQYKKAAFVTNAYQYVFLWLSGLLLVPRVGSVDTHVLRRYVWYFIGGGLCFAMTNVCVYKALSYVDAAVGSIFNTISVVFTVVLAALVLHQRLTGLQLVGSAVLMSAVIYSMLALRARGASLARWQLEAGFFYSVLAGIFFAIAIVNEQWLLQHMSAASYIVFGWGWQMLAAFGLAIAFQRKRFRQVLFGDKWHILVVSGALRGLGGVAFVLAQIRSHNVALITVLANLKLIVVLVLGVLVLKERHKLWHKTVGAFASLAGLSIMFWK